MSEIVKSKKIDVDNFILLTENRQYFEFMTEVASEFLNISMNELNQDFNLDSLNSLMDSNPFGLSYSKISKIDDLKSWELKNEGTSNEIYSPKFGLGADNGLLLFNYRAFRINNKYASLNIELPLGFYSKNSKKRKNKHKFLIPKESQMHSIFNKICKYKENLENDIYNSYEVFEVPDTAKSCIVIRPGYNSLSKSILPKYDVRVHNDRFSLKTMYTPVNLK